MKMCLTSIRIAGTRKKARRSKFGLRRFDIQSGRIKLSLLSFFPPDDGDSDIVPVRSRIGSGDAHRLPQLEIICATQRVSDQVGAGVIVDESPSAIDELATLGFAFDGGGTCGGRDEFGEVGFGY